MAKKIKRKYSRETIVAIGNKIIENMRFFRNNPGQVYSDLHFVIVDRIEIDGEELQFQIDTEMNGGEYLEGAFEDIFGRIFEDNILSNVDLEEDEITTILMELHEEITSEDRELSIEEERRKERLH